MIEAFVITLREGVEAALVVGLTLGYLRKIGRPELGRAALAGVVLAAVLSIGAAVLLKLTGFSTEGGVEGIVLLSSSALVSWLVYWMWRHGKSMKKDTESRLDRITKGSSFGIFLFAFVTVLREGAEMVVMLVPVDFTSDSVLAAGAAVTGLAIAVGVGIAFYKGTFRVDLRKFFSVTSIILILFAFQLLVSGLHEFAEVGWLPENEWTMRVIGPLMKHSAIFVIAVLALPFVFLLRGAAAPAPAGNEAEDRKARAQFRAERIAKGVFAVLAIVVILALGIAYVHETRELVLSPPETVFDAQPEIAVPIASVSDGKLHRFAVKVGGKLLRFLVVRPDEKKEEYGTAMDACTICNDWGYVQVGEDRVLCRNCVAEINRPTIGSGGGCNPIPLAHERRGTDLVIKIDAITAHAAYFKTGQRVTVRCAVCEMELDAEKAGRVKGKWYCDMPGLPCKKALEEKP